MEPSLKDFNMKCGIDLSQRKEILASLKAGDHTLCKNLYDCFVDELTCGYDPIMAELFRCSFICLVDNVWSFRLKMSDDKGRGYHHLNEKYNHLFKKTAGEWLPIFKKYFPIDAGDVAIMLQFENPYVEAKKYREMIRHEVENMKTK